MTIFEKLSFCEEGTYFAIVSSRERQFSKGEIMPEGQGTGGSRVPEGGGFPLVISFFPNRGHCGPGGCKVKQGLYKSFMALLARACKSFTCPSNADIGVK